jgi:Family of unknown function (DUF6494)
VVGASSLHSPYRRGEIRELAGGNDDTRLAVSMFMTEHGTQLPNEDALNMSVRKFLKQVGITAQRETENAVREAYSKGEITSKEVLSARATITVGLTSLNLVVDGQIELNSPRPAVEDA